MVKQKINSLEKIKEEIKANNNFVLKGGAGSGKTRSLIDVLDFLYEKNPTNKIACITFTNVAADEITKRMEGKKINLRSSTIHDFLWDSIKNYQKNLKKAVLELIDSSEIKYEGEEEINENYFKDKNIDYREWKNIENGIISHDEVLKLASKLIKEHSLIRKILGDKYDYILIDEYQDTDPCVIEIFLDYFEEKDNPPLIGLFGDSMQSIYEKRIGNLDSYISCGKIKEVIKEDNWRCSKSVISLINKVRNDGVEQKAVGSNLEGKIVFLYTKNDIDITKIKHNELFKEFNFEIYEENKELYLTHKLISKQFGFESLLSSYKYKDSLTGDNPDKLISHLLKIQEIIDLYDSKNYNLFLKKTDYKITKDDELKLLKSNIEKLKKFTEDKTIKEIIEEADKLKLIIKDDKVIDFINSHEEQFDQIKDIEYEEIVNLYKYRDKNSPYSTQHGVKGAEFQNVFVILDNGNWNQYNFTYLFEERSDKESIVERTRKIFYVCCSRAKENLIVLFPKPSDNVLNKAKEWFGSDNIIEV
jgi:DNA helicase-2/ATP-dependent DNA helicase PcrA